MASKRKQRRDSAAQCKRKVHYDDEATAQLAGSKMRGRYPGELFDAYRCECGRFVIGHRPKQVRYAIDKKRRKQQ